MLYILNPDYNLKGVGVITKSLSDLPRASDEEVVQLKFLVPECYALLCLK